MQKKWKSNLIRHEKLKTRLTTSFPYGTLAEKKRNRHVQQNINVDQQIGNGIDLNGMNRITLLQNSNGYQKKHSFL